MPPRLSSSLAALLLTLAACTRTPPPVSVAPLAPKAYAHYLAGKYALYRDDPATAADELRLAALAAPDQPMIAVELARALGKAQRTAAAHEVLVFARKKWPHHPQVWLASGEVLEHDQATRGEALAAYKRAIKLEPGDQHAYLGLARTQAAAGDSAAAERTLRKLISRVPSSIEGHYKLAQRLEQRGDRNGAITELRAVLEHEPDHLDARLDLARTLRRTGKLDEAIAQTRSAFDRAGQPMDIAEELFWLLCEADDRQAAIDLLTLLDDERSDADALSTVAHLQRGLGRTSESRAIASRLRLLDPDAATIVLAETDLADGLAESAADKALSVPAKSKRYQHAQRVAIDALLAAGQPRRALELIAPLRKAKKNDLALIYVEAIARADAGDRTAARALATKLGANSVEAAYVRARILEHLGDVGGAVAILETALVDHPDHVGALNLAGYLLVEHADTLVEKVPRTREQRLNAAARYLAKARDLQPGDPAILDSWGWLLYQQGKARDAIRVLDRAARFSPREPEILVHLAAAWAADGAPRTAAEVLDRAAKLRPSPTVKTRIDALRAKLGIR